MIEVTDDLVSYVALLSRLDLSDEEARGMSEHFRKVLGYVEDLQELDLERVDPSLFSLDASDVLRDDEPADSLPNEAAMDIAPSTEPPYFLLPRIVDAGGEA